jgi:hypothetical protein
MMLQGAAAGWVTGLLAETMRSPSYHGLKAAFEDNYFKAKNYVGKTLVLCGMEHTL